MAGVMKNTQICCFITAFGESPRRWNMGFVATSAAS